MGFLVWRNSVISCLGLQSEPISSIFQNPYSRLAGAGGVVLGALAVKVVMVAALKFKKIANPELALAKIESKTKLTEGRELALIDTTLIDAAILGFVCAEASSSPLLFLANCIGGVALAIFQQL